MGDTVKCDVSLDSMLQTDMYISWLPSLWVLELVMLLSSFFFCIDSLFFFDAIDIDVVGLQ